LSDVTLLKSTAAILVAAMFVGDRTVASTLLAGSAAVPPTLHIAHGIYQPEPVLVALPAVLID